MGCHDAGTSVCTTQCFPLNTTIAQCSSCGNCFSPSIFSTGICLSVTPNLIATCQNVTITAGSTIGFITTAIPSSAATGSGTGGSTGSGTGSGSTGSGSASSNSGNSASTGSSSTSHTTSIANLARLFMDVYVMFALLVLWCMY